MQVLTYTQIKYIEVNMSTIKMKSFESTHGKNGAPEMIARAKLMIIIRDMIDDHEWSQKQAAEKLGVTQARISKLKGGKINDFSLDMLFSFLGKLGYSLEPTYNRKVLKINVKAA